MVVTSGSSEFTHTWTEVSALPLRPPVKVTPQVLVSSSIKWVQWQSLNQRTVVRTKGESA